MISTMFGQHLLEFNLINVNWQYLNNCDMRLESRRIWVQHLVFIMIKSSKINSKTLFKTYSEMITLACKVLIFVACGSLINHECSGWWRIWRSVISTEYKSISFSDMVTRYWMLPLTGEAVLGAATPGEAAWTEDLWVLGEVPRLSHAVHAELRNHLVEPVQTPLVDAEGEWNCFLLK